LNGQPDSALLSLLKQFLDDESAMAHVAFVWRRTRAEKDHTPIWSFTNRIEQVSDGGGIGESLL
jgi:hypothetical protein